jgi:3-methyladenine DNA glycosylase AlkC
MAKKNPVEKVENENALKHLFNRDLLKRMSDALGEADPSFDRKSFLGLMPKLEPLEMKPRVRFLRDELRRQLPEDFPKALKILLRSLKSGKISGFDLWPYTEFVQTYGLEHPELSLQALKKNDSPIYQ